MRLRESSRPGSLAVCLVLLAAFLGLSWAQGEGSYVRINDNLDGYVPLYVVLAEDEPVLGGLHDSVERILDGLPRNAMPTTINVGPLLFYVLDPLRALIANEVAARVVAFFGMLLLLRVHLLPRAADPVVYGASLCFALLPFLPAGYLSVAGQPLLAYALLQLARGRGGVLDWLVVAAFPLYSSLVYIGAFVLLVLALSVVWVVATTRAIPWRLVAAGLLMTALYAASEYRLLYQALAGSGYTSFRYAFDRHGTGLLGAIRNGVDSFLFSQHHAAAAQFPVILGAIAAALLLRLGRLAGAGTRGLRSGVALLREPLGRLVLVAAGVSGAIAVWHFGPAQQLVQAGPAILRAFNFHRIQWFHPALFGVAFAFALAEVRAAPRFGPAAALALLVLQGACLVVSDDAVQERLAGGVSYRAFYSTGLFAEIQEHIGRPPSEYRVVSLGLVPGIALYNGFYVLDGFFNDYPMDYKRRFRRVMEAELEKDEQLRRHFDDWGAHLHLYAHELGMVVGYRKPTLYTKEHGTRRVSVDFDTGALRALGCDFVLSAVEVANAEALGWKLERSFERDDSPWRVFLYGVPPEAAARRAGPGAAESPAEATRERDRLVPTILQS